MKSIQKIISNRNIIRYPSWDLVYEWEDVFSRELGADIGYLTYYARIINKICPALKNVLLSGRIKFIFHMIPRMGNSIDNSASVVPLIIDFFIRAPRELEQFYKAYDRCKVVLISSKEAYDFLKSVNCPLPIRHLALSIPDKYAIDKYALSNKTYDLILSGRQNDRHRAWLETYMKNHPDLYYVYRVQDGGVFNYYTNKGESLGNLSTRDDFMNLIRKSKIALYATPGIEGDVKRTNGFHQVTPRFLENIACGCHIIASYEKNSDTEYYEIDKFSPNISSYEEFEEVLNRCRPQPVDIEMYEVYLAKHYTSQRAKELTSMISRI